MSRHRPTSENKRVTPTALYDHRQSHQFLGPCCLCPLFAQDGRGAFVEAAILIETLGPHSGQYVAKCAQGQCGYLGQSPYSLRESDVQAFHAPVFIEDVYAQPYGVLLRAYPPRSKGPVPYPDVRETDRF